MSISLDFINNAGEGGSQSKFSDPFIMPSSASFPTELRSNFDFSLYLYYLNPLFISAMSRVFAYFITDIRFSDIRQADQEEGRKFKKILTEDIDIFGALQMLGENWSAYGNSFVRFHRPFDRSYIVTKPDGSLASISSDQLPPDLVTYLPKEVKYRIPDPFQRGVALAERRKIEVDFEDKRSSDTSRLALTFLDVRYVDLDRAHFSGKKTVTYRFPAHVRARIDNGELREVNETPKSILEVLARGEDFEFYPGEVFHLAQPCPVGISEAGWGLPPVIQHYRNIRQIQMYRKSDESVALDFMLPFRVFSPASAGNNVDATQDIVSSMMRGELKAMVEHHRRDPTSMHSFPVPIRMDEFGGNGRHYISQDIRQQQTHELLDGIGIPQDLMRGTLANAEMPTAMRIFESQYQWLMRALNSFVLWVGDKVQDFREVDRISAGLDRPSQAQNIEARQTYMQLAAAGEIPRRYSLRPIGIDDPVAAAAERADEDLAIMEQQAEKQEAFERKQQRGSMAEVVAAQAQEGATPPGGGGIGPIGPNPNHSPLDIQNEAQNIAAQLLQIPEDGVRSQELQKIKAGDPTMHAAVKQAMEEMRSGAASQGRAQVGEMLAQQGP